MLKAMYLPVIKININNILQIFIQVLQLLLLQQAFPDCQ